MFHISGAGDRVAISRALVRVRERAREACVCIEKKRELYVKTVVTEKTARTKRLFDKETESRIVRGFYLCRSNFYTILAACQSENSNFL